MFRTHSVSAPCVFLFPKLKIFPIYRQVSLEFCISMLDMPLLIYCRFFRLQVCLNLFFLSRSSCLSSELLVLLEIFSPRDCKFSFSVSHSWSNHLFCDLHLILQPLTFNPASLHASTKVSLSNSDAVSMLLCFTAASNLDWTVCDLRPFLSLSLDWIFQKSLLYSVKMTSADVSYLIRKYTLSFWP